jgi:hypothetical protein
MTWGKHKMTEMSKARLDARYKQLAKKFQKEFEIKEWRSGQTKLLTPDDEKIKEFLARKHRANMSEKMLERKKYQVLLKKEKPPKPRKIKVRK